MVHPRQSHGRGSLLQAAIVMTSIHQFTNAAPFPRSHTRTSPNMMLVPNTGGDKSMTINNIDYYLMTIPNSLPSSRRRRRRILSKITSLRGGGPLSSSPNKSKDNNIGTAIGNDVGTLKPHNSNNPNNIHVSNGGGGSINPSSILSTAILIVTSSFNVASAALVLSGYFGAWIASWMVGKLHEAVPALTETNGSSNILGGITGGNESNLFLGKYRYATAASAGFLLLHTLGIRSHDIYSRVGDASFLAVLWMYSHLVHPILGGAIGCTHVSLGALSALLDNPKLGNALDQLGNVRLKKLGQYAGEEDPYIVPGKGRLDAMPVLASRPRGEVTTFIANMMGSASLLISFPQYCLGLYMLGSSLVAWWSSSSSSSMKQSDGGVWKRFGKWMEWLSEGVAIDNVVDERIDPWNLSKRLVALYWITALGKAAIAYTLL